MNDTCNNSLNPLQNIVSELTSVAATFHDYAPLSSQSAVKGSRTRAQVWKEIESHPNTRANLDVPTQRSITLAHTAEEIASRLACLSSAHNANHYTQAATLLETFFRQEATFGPTYGLNTHRQRFLDDCAPDISIQRNASSADKFNIALVIDIKLSHLSTSANKGQIIDYLHSLASWQPGRTTFLGILTDFESAEMIKMVVGVPKTRTRRISNHMAGVTTVVSHYRSQPLCDILKLAYAELSAPQANPRKFHLSEQLGTLVRVLQLSPHTVVAELRSATKATNCVVKAALDTQGFVDVEHEVRILESLQGPTKPAAIPSLIYSFPREFCIEPVGRPFTLEAFKNTKEMRAVLGDVLCALEWVHNHNLVHRDVRTDNLVLVRDSQYPDRSIRAVLIDFDRSAAIGKTTTYEGGYICCPEEVLHQLRSRAHSCSNLNPETLEADPDTPMTISFGDEVHDAYPDVQAPLDLITYTPHPKHDFLAFVILLNQLLFPFTFQRYAYHLIEKVHTKEQERLFKLWSSLKLSRVWGPIVDCAENMAGGGRVVADWAEWLDIVVLL